MQSNFFIGFYIQSLKADKITDKIADIKADKLTIITIKSVYNYLPLPASPYTGTP